MTMTRFSHLPLDKPALVAFIWLAACCQPGLTQPVPASVLQIEVRDIVRYNEDLSDVTKFASDPSATVPNLPRNFYEVIHIGDIIAVNGSPVKGTYITCARYTNTMLAPNPGEAIADTSIAGLNEVSFDILAVDGTRIGSLFGLGLSRSSPAPGAPSVVTSGNHVIIGGSGAFLGVRGSFGQAATDQTIPIRNASITEDPASRRKNGGGRILLLIQLIPYIVPQIATDSGEPEVFHADFSPVNRARPATAGETLIVRASGLGPTRPGVDPGQPFPSDVEVVNAPVEATVSGQPAQVLNAFGWPGTLDRYRVDFRVPDGTAGPIATIQLTAGFISGTPVNIPVQ